jgi:hypothetical protein
MPKTSDEEKIENNRAVMNVYGSLGVRKRAAARSLAKRDDGNGSVDILRPKTSR